MNEIVLDEECRQRFLDGFDRPDDGCWIWKGRKDRDGYGKLSVKKREYTTHRVAWLVFHDQQPGSLHVLHSCDTPSCVRPDHLFLGSNADNVRDRGSKGRTNARLTWDIVNEMRRLYRETDMTTREIDAHFGYVGSHVILSNRLWYDPEYVRPQKPSCPRSRLLSAYGEEKTAREWSEDPRCQVSVRLIRERMSRGKEGEAVLHRDSNAGRPRKTT